MFFLHCVFFAAACLVGWIAAIGMGVLFHAPSGANPFLIIGLPIAITNCIAASIACRRISSEGARWVWIPWALLILSTYTNYPPAQTMGEHLRNMWNQVFSSNCGATECLGQLFLGMPLGGSVIYAVTSVLTSSIHTNKHRANQIERYVLFGTGTGLLLLRVVLAVTITQPTLVQARMFTIVLMLAAGAFGGALPGAIAAEGTDPSSAAKAIGAIGSALAVAFIYRWLL